MKNKLRKPRSLARALAPLLAAASLVPLQAGTFSNNFDTDPVTPGTVLVDGSAKWVDSGGGAGYISITDAANSLNGLMTVPDFDNGELVGGFTATFKLAITPGSGNPADGFSFNWASDLPANAGSVSEEGGGTGLTIAFDIYDNGGGEAPSIDVKVGGNTIAQKKMTKAEIMTTGFADVRIQYQAGLLNVDYKGLSVFASLPAGVPPQAGAVFGFGARTGGENANQWIDDLNITTVPPTAPTVTTFRNNAKGFLVSLVDAPTSQVDQTSVSATVDGNAVTGTVTKTGDTTTFTYNNPALYTVGSVHNVVLTYKHGTPATTVNTPLSFTVGPFTTIPDTSALAAGVIDVNKRGFLWRVHQVDGAEQPNTLARTENQLSGLVGDNIADPAAQNGADAPSTAPVPITAPIQFTVSTVINFTDGTDAGRFPADTIFPGIPGLTAGNESIAGEVVTGIEFPAAGIYRLVVNSDDGFRTTMGKNPRDPSNPVLGFFDGGRGPTDSPFEIYIGTAGVYPMRTIWEEGGGGAALEIFTENLDGSRHLLNDTTDANALKTYQLPPSALPAYLGTTSPASGEKAITRPSTIEAHLFDSGTTVTDGSTSMKLNGVNMPSTATRTGNETKVVGTPAAPLLGNTVYTVDLTYSDNTGPHTVSWTFTAGPLSQTLFTIEAEDFDYSDDNGVTGGKHNPQKGTAGMDVDVMPYYGGAYDGLSSAFNIDYNGDDPGDGGNYRTEDRYFQDPGPDPNNPRTEFNDVSIYSNNNVAGGNGLGGNLSINSSDRGTYQTTVNYSLGWSGGDWYNYTREFPDNGTGGWWEVYFGLSYGGADAGQLSTSLARVTSGVGTTTQTLDNLGSVSGPGSGNWTRNNLVPMRNASGGIAVVKLQGLQTVRAIIGSGDYDFIIFSAAPPPPPSIDSAPLDSVKRDAGIFDWVLKDGGSLVNPATVQVTINNQDVTSKTTTTKTASGATVHVDLSGTLLTAGPMPWTLSFKDNASTPQTVSGSGTLQVNPYPTPGTFVIEAEDFNYSDDDITGGKTNPLAGTPDQDVNVMPYLGGAYNNLSAIPEVDFHGNDGQDGNIYRTEKDPNPANPAEVNMVSFSNDVNGRYATDRGIFTTTANYRIGWAGDNWFNYTRTFPANDYQVWAALSFGGRGAGQLHGTLDMVTSDPTKTGQLTQQLGTFDAPGSGDWGRNELVPLKDSAGAITTVHLEGTKTVRYNMPTGDFDYLLFVPQIVGPELPKFTKFQINASGSITIEWTGTATLESTPALTPNPTWTTIQDATSPFTFTPQPGTPVLFARLKQSP